MSENRIAASTPWRRTGCIVISQVRSGVRQACSIPVSARSARYSGSERPAWRMNQTGSRSGRSPRAAARNADSGSDRRMGTVVSGFITPHRPTSAARDADRPDRRAARLFPPVPPPALQSRPVPDPAAPPPLFRRAVDTLAAVRPRPELVVRSLEAPPRLAPYSWATSVEADIVHRGDGTDDLDEPRSEERRVGKECRVR